MRTTAINYNANMKFCCACVDLVDHPTVARLRVMRLLIEIWQVSEYGKFVRAFARACRFSRKRTPRTTEINTAIIIHNNANT